VIIFCGIRLELNHNCIIIFKHK